MQLLNLRRIFSSIDKFKYRSRNKLFKPNNPPELVQPKLKKRSDLMLSQPLSVKANTSMSKFKGDLISSLAQPKNIKGLHSGISHGRLATTKNETGGIINMNAVITSPEENIRLDKRMVRSKSNYKTTKSCLNNQSVITINARGMNGYQPTHNRATNKSYIDNREQRKVSNLNFIYLNPTKANLIQFDSSPKKQFLATAKFLNLQAKEDLPKINKSFQLPIPIKVINQSKKSTKFTTTDTLTNQIEENIEELHMNLVYNYQKIHKVLRKVELNDIELIDSNDISKHDI